MNMIIVVVVLVFAALAALVVHRIMSGSEISSSGAGESISSGVADRSALLVVSGLHSVDGVLNISYKGMCDNASHVFVSPYIDVRYASSEYSNPLIAGEQRIKLDNFVANGNVAHEIEVKIAQGNYVLYITSNNGLYRNNGMIIKQTKKV